MNKIWLKRHVKQINLFLILFFGFSSFVFFLMNGGAYWRILRYSLFLASPLSAGEDLSSNILEVQAAAQPVSPNGNPSPSSQSQIARDSGIMKLVIPKIGVAVPIIVPSDPSNKGVLAALEEGVGMYPSSAGPGAEGRSIVLGHSSRASWYRGEWAYVFSLLPKLGEGDEFYVTSNGKKYIYRVFSTKVLSPSDTNVLLAGPHFGSEIDLITCYPIGSASKRNVVQAQLIATENI